MNWIAHRGNMFGPNSELENKPEYIEATLKLGYDVEVDVWSQSDGLYLGHSSPTYKINRYFLQNQSIWSHCKNVSTYMELSKFTNINCFFQEQEEMVMTSRGYLWAHSKCEIWNKNTIITKLDSRNWDAPTTSFAICSDYIIEQNTKYSLPFDLLIIDIDGVMTNGTKMYDRDGKVFGKTFCDLDFTAIKRFLSAGVKVCFLSGDQIVNKSMAETRKIPFYHNSPGTDKVDMLSSIKKEYNANRVAYVGDDYYDLAIMNAVDFAFCPISAPLSIRNSSIVINIEAGKGVIAGLYDKFESKIKYVFPIDAVNVNPK